MPETTPIKWPKLPKRAGPTHEERKAARVLARNQCDGCRAGMPLRGDIHVDEQGRAVQGCEAHRYVEPGAAIGRQM